MYVQDYLTSFIGFNALTGLVLMFCAADKMNKRIVRWRALVTNFSSLCLLGVHLDLFWRDTGKGFHACLLVTQNWQASESLLLEMPQVWERVDVQAVLPAWARHCPSCSSSHLLLMLDVTGVLETGLVYWARAFPFSGCLGLAYWSFSRKKNQTYSYLSSCKLSVCSDVTVYVVKCSLVHR